VADLEDDDLSPFPECFDGEGMKDWPIPIHTNDDDELEINDADQNIKEFVDAYLEEKIQQFNVKYANGIGFYDFNPWHHPPGDPYILNCNLNVNYF
jgi:hypothetical protein